MRIKSPRFVVLLGLAGGCATASMKPPPGVAAATPLAVVGHSGSVKTFRENEIKLGGYQVANIDRDWDKKSSSGAGPWSREAKKKAYRYDIQSQGRTLHGECTEQAVEHSVGGFGKQNVSFTCVCAENGANVAQLELANQAGTAQVGSANSYQVAAVHESEQGAKVSSALGYHFRGPHGEGAVDVTGSGRAWLPAQVDQEESFALVCQYAGLFLYRPTSW